MQRNLHEAAKSEQTIFKMVESGWSGNSLKTLIYVFLCLEDWWNSK